MPRRCANAAEHFWSRVDRAGGSDACWPWQGYTRPDGYGETRIFGERRITAAHRYAFHLANGWMPSGHKRGDLIVRHRCDNRLCCNPAHLELGTHKENTEDCRVRGRWIYPPRPKGAAAYRAKLTDQQVAWARKASASMKMPEIAAALGVHLETARRIVKGQSYPPEAKAQMNDVLQSVGRSG